MSNWQRASDALFGPRPATDEEAATREFVLDTAQAWVDGGLPLVKVMELTSARDRATAIRFCDLLDARRPAMHRLFDAICIANGDTITPVGVFGVEELAQGEARKTVVDGREVIQFAVGHEKSTGRPIYPSSDPTKRGPQYRDFRPGGQPKAEPKEPEKKWETGGESE